MPRLKKIFNWGCYPVVKNPLFKHVSSEAEVNYLIDEHVQFAPRGCGKSYGDSSLNHAIASSKGFSMFRFNKEDGIIQVGSGISLDRILKEVVPHGFFLPVTPGTKLISVGGAIAADIHGKNHHKEGNISRYIKQMAVYTPDHGEIQCSVTSNPELFWATCGGMGLTGYILWAEIQLKPIETVYIKQRSIKTANLSETIKLLKQHADYTYSVAWIDCLKKGKSMGRSVVLLGEHASPDDLSTKQNNKRLEYKAKQKFNIPFFFPSFVLNRLSVKAFNFLYYNKQFKKDKEVVVHYEPYFYPLDTVGNWNRIYGRSGFTQYQFVLPPETSEKGMEEILRKLSTSGQASFLAVLKMFGPERENNYITFPREGLNLALDIKLNKATFKLLDEIDRLVQKHGGRVYLAKDSRMSHEFFEDTYPDLDKFKKIVNHYNSKHLLSTLQSERLGLTNKSSEASNTAFMSHLLILGANSDIAKATAKRFARSGWSLMLAVRNKESIQEFASDLRSAYTDIDVSTHEFDAENMKSHEPFYKELPIKPQAVLCAFGYLPDNSVSLNSNEEVMRSINVNYVGAVSILNIIAGNFKSRGEGSILGISSVAGDRGRGSNFLYGSPKAGFTAYLSGLRNALLRSGVHVCTIKPGFVKTKMISGIQTPGPLTASPEQTANAIYRGFKRRKSVVYTKSVWRLIMWIIRHIPEFIFKRMSL